ncbi:Hypothetical predicted protein, partial [Podarcis lilfordi]
TCLTNENGGNPTVTHLEYVEECSAKDDLDNTNSSYNITARPPKSRYRMSVYL